MIIDFLESLKHKPLPNKDYNILFGEGDTPAKIENFISTFNVFTCFPEYEPNGRKFLKRTLKNLPETHIIVLINWEILEQAKAFEELFKNKVIYCMKNKHGYSPSYDIIKNILKINGVYNPNFFGQGSSILTQPHFKKILLHPNSMIPTKFKISFKNINTLYETTLLLVKDFIDIYSSYQNYMNIRLNQLQVNERNLCNLLSLYISCHYSIKIIVNYGLKPTFSIQNGEIKFYLLNEEFSH